MLAANDQALLDDLYDSMVEASDSMLGYPFTRGFDYEPLYRFLKFPAYNVGDPFRGSNCRINTFKFEREVIEFFASFFNAPSNDYWGYVTSGGTEGNFYGIYVARELYPNGVVYFSQDTHYSVAKSVYMLGLRSQVVQSQKNGEMDYEDLREQVRRHRDVPAIIVANIGTTMTEAIDDIRLIRSITSELGVEDCYIHSDAALCGAYAPFLNPRPAFDFTDGADSITVSGHKFIGTPIACGVLITKQRHIEKIGLDIRYIASADRTVSGTRNGFTPLLLWYAIKTLGQDGLRRRLEECEALTSYAIDSLISKNIPAWRNENALTIIFPKVSDHLRVKWQLATQNVSHLMVMPGIQREQIDALVADMVGAQPANRASALPVDYLTLTAS